MKLSEIVVALEGLAQESRLGIFRLLVVAGPDGLPAGKIADRMKLPAPTLSFHLAQLKHAGLIACERQGRSLIYSTNFKQMSEVVQFLTENCCGSAVICPPACTPAQLKRKEKTR